MTRLVRERLRGLPGFAVVCGVGLLLAAAVASPSPPFPSPRATPDRHKQLTTPAMRTRPKCG